MPNKRIDQLNPNLNSLTGNELIPIFDLSSNTTEKITVDTLGAYIDSTNDTFISSVGFNNSTDLLTLYRNDGTNLSTTINRYNRWYVPSGQTLTIPNNFQSFIYGDFLVEGTVNLQENGQLVVLNGDIILSGGTIIGSGTTYSVDLPKFNTFVTNGIFNNTTKQINFTGNYGFTPFNVDLSQLVSNNTYTTGATLNGDVLEFNRNDLNNAYSVDLSSLKFTGNTSGDCISDLHVSNIHSCSPLHINPNDEGNVYFGSSSSVSVDVVSGDISANTINATTYYGDGSNLTNVGGVNYKIYSALLTQTGTTAPYPIQVFQDDLGDVSFGYNIVGSYSISSSFFVDGKTFINNINPYLADNYPISVGEAIPNSAHPSFGGGPSYISVLIPSVFNKFSSDNKIYIGSLYNTMSA